MADYIMKQSSSIICDTLAESTVEGAPVLDIVKCKAEFCDAGVEGKHS